MANSTKKPMAAALGAAFLASAIAPAAMAADANPFKVNPLNSGYDLVNKSEAEGKCGEGKCGEGKCGEETEEGAGEE